MNKVYARVLESKKNSQGWFAKAKMLDDTNSDVVVFTGDVEIPSDKRFYCMAEVKGKVLVPTTEIKTYDDKPKTKYDDYQVSVNIGNACNVAFNLKGSQPTKELVKEVFDASNTLRDEMIDEHPDVNHKDIMIKVAESLKQSALVVAQDKYPSVNKLIIEAKKMAKNLIEIEAYIRSGL